MNPGNQSKFQRRIETLVRTLGKHCFSQGRRGIRRQRSLNFLYLHLLGLRRWRAPAEVERRSLLSGILLSCLVLSQTSF